MATWAFLASGEYLSPSEAARALDLSASRVRQLLDAGTLRGQVSPLGRLIERTSVEELRAERAARAATR